MEGPIGEFRRWFLDHGGSFGDHVELQHDSVRGVHLRVAQGSRVCSASGLISCPHTLTLSYFDVTTDGEPFTNKSSQDNVASATGLISPLNALRFFLIEQFHLGKSSRWHPYINLLPSPFEDYPFNTPFYYKGEDAKWLEGTSLEHGMRSTERLWRDEHLQGLEKLRPNNILLGYGFTLFRNASDHCNLALGSVAAARIADKLARHTAASYRQAPRSEVCSEKSIENSTTGIGWVRLPYGSQDRTSAQSEPPSLVFSPGFLEQASMAFSNAREDDWEMLGNTLDLSPMGLTRNKLHTACAIAMLLQKQYMEMAVRNADLPAWPKNDRQFHAARYRRRQYHILSTAIQSIIHSLRRLVGLDPSWPRDKRIVGLNHVLKAGPKDFLTDFRALLHVGFGTRKPERLRRQMLVESALTLWLCGLWLWVQTVPISGSIASRAPLPAPTALWIQFVCKTYGEVSDIGRSWQSIPASKEGELLAGSCQTIVDAAVAKNPLTIYNHPEVTASRLLWCLRVFREESFMCPNLEGEVDDETDELMLFLQGDAYQDQSIA
ncbi:MAG: hypothetical protein Q9220_004734 [cf. Caloplaca sp. 1 TL-2023]